MGCFRVPSPTPSACSDARIPEPQEGDTKPRVRPGVRTRRLSRAFSEPDQPAAKRRKVKPSDTTRPAKSFCEPKTSTKDENWTIFVGNLHPRTTPAELYALFNESAIRNIVIRNARGCGVTTIPDESMGPDDRCYASIEFKEFEAAWRVLQEGKKEPPPEVHGLPVLIKISAADMPEAEIIMERIASVATERPVSKRKRLAGEKTELDIENQPKPLAGPSARKKIQLKPR